MKKAYLGIDTSCYTTSVAAVLQDGEHIIDHRTPIPVVEGMVGIRQQEQRKPHCKIAADRLFTAKGQTKFEPKGLLS